jgi:hypothetical protein
MSFATPERRMMVARPGWRHRILRFVVVAGPASS